MFTHVVTQVSRLARFSLVVIFAAMFSGCGGGSGGSSAASQSKSAIPTTIAVPSSGRPNVSPEQHVPALSYARLTHIYRDAFLAGDRSDSALSPNGEVEQLTSLGLYEPVDASDDGSYRIELQDNDLAYFRVINTKANGAERVHLFYGVPAGDYMTFDSSDFDAPAQSTDSGCRDVSVRINALTTAANRRLLLNGEETKVDIAEGAKAWIDSVNLCPLQDTDSYLLVVTQDIDGDINYGFEFYRQLSDNDVLELTIEHAARMVPWTSNVPVNYYYTVAGKHQDWDTIIKLYTPPLDEEEAESLPAPITSGLLPAFDAIGFDRVVWSAESSALHNREFAASAEEIAFELQQIDIRDISLDPISIEWSDNGLAKPKIISGIIFDDSATQTYAFISMDPKVLRQSKLQFPIEDIELLVDSVFVGVYAASNMPDSSEGYITSAGISAGLIALPNDNAHPLNNQDSVFAGNAAGIFELLIDWLGD
ncbi:hypothetical protein IC617_10060 [Neiella sp. HB171785]|uniref:Uncharacterized protein n=1 Tax=Neiella litorisoli TaxID=2771431 RepID=A0A8J6R308_9GAMM|nr:hypothetical protein [Neiella litorisoli]MBD1389770.1 hypothetical protein [Neiella litorisoli]